MSNAPLFVFDEVAKEGREQILYDCDEAFGFKAALIAIDDTTPDPASGGTRLLRHETERDALEDALRLAGRLSHKASAVALEHGDGKAAVVGDRQTRQEPTSSKGIPPAGGLFAGRLRHRGRCRSRRRRPRHGSARNRTVRQNLPDRRWCRRSIAVDRARSLRGRAGGRSASLGKPEVSGERFSVQGVERDGSAYVRSLIENRAEVVVSEAYGPAA